MLARAAVVYLPHPDSPARPWIRPGESRTAKSPDNDRVRLTMPAIRDPSPETSKDSPAHRTLSFRVRPELWVIASAMRLTPRDTAPMARAGTIV